MRLEGVRVLEFTHAILGPACGLVLADMGADVLKIEPPQGDHTRTLKGFGAGYFPMFNRNKRSLAVDLKHTDGKAIIYELVKSADVLIENFAPNTMQRLGLGYDVLSALNPRLIYCTLKGFMAGPYEHRVALDEVVQMMSGLAYMTGPDGQPLRVGTSVTDIMGGTFGALGVLGALYERERTGKGALVQNGLFETAAYMMGQNMIYSVVTGEPIPPMAGRKRSWAVYQPFASQEGDLVFVGITSDKHWQSFCEVFERPDLFNDPTLATNALRYDAFERLTGDLKAFFATMPKAEMIAKCDRAGIPFAPINRPEDLFTDEHLNATGGLLDVQLADGLSARLPALPLQVDGQGYGLYLPPPRVGEHTRTTLHALGYDDGRIDALIHAGILAGQ
jgi:crotonobetainyl-CoA:carnitine CoA-transferase CaiB-like acyl-CoA transferase